MKFYLWRIGLKLARDAANLIKTERIIYARRAESCASAEQNVINTETENAIYAITASRARLVVNYI